jgi:hypothetical protein
MGHNIRALRSVLWLWYGIYSIAYSKGISARLCAGRAWLPSLSVLLAMLCPLRALPCVPFKLPWFAVCVLPVSLVAVARVRAL